MEEQQQLCAIDFKKVVETYVSYSNQEKQLKATLKQLREDKAAVTEKILSYMKDINVDSCRLPSGGRVAVKVTHKKPKLTGKELMELIGTHSPTLCAIIDREEGNKEEQVKTTLVHKS